MFRGCARFRLLSSEPEGGRLHVEVVAKMTDAADGVSHPPLASLEADNDAFSTDTLLVRHAWKFTDVFLFQPLPIS